MNGANGTVRIITDQLQRHRLRNIRPHISGPGQVWTCTCDKFGVAVLPVRAVDAHDEHIAQILVGEMRLSPAPRRKQREREKAVRLRLRNRRSQPTIPPESRAT